MIMQLLECFLTVRIANMIRESPYKKKKMNEYKRKKVVCKECWIAPS